ncbi:hypothetical protein niasHS_016517 [Heterodera schachtii]|uniref:JmjC domain-containing protein n=1 Tax=Heterodera schachtii TaxID=97005 RepID=A0ABD2I175_HETSC
MIEVFDFWYKLNFFNELLAYLRNDNNWKKVSAVGGLAIKLRHEQWRPISSGARRTTGGEVGQTLGGCQPGGSRCFVSEGADASMLPAEIAECKILVDTMKASRANSALSYLMYGNGVVRKVTTIFRKGKEVLPFIDETDAGLERFFNEIVNGPLPQEWRYGTRWFVPDAKTTESYRLITDLLLACNGTYGKMGLDRDATLIRGICAPPETSLFALHREDEHVHHLNYNLGPGLKLWLFIGGGLEKQVSELGQVLFTDRWPKCPNPLGHNSYIFSPAQLRQAGIPFEFHIQRPGDVVLTVGLHCGINVGASVCLVKELCSPRAAQQFKKVGEHTRCDCKGREAYKFTEKQTKEYLGGIKAMESEARANDYRQKYEQSGKRVRADNEVLAAQRRAQREKQKAEGRVPIPKKKGTSSVINLDEVDLE